MPLDVGDAVLTFLADTQHLDQAFAVIPEKTDAAMSAAAASVGQVGDALKGVSFELDATGSNAAYAGGEIKEAMHEVSVSTREARGEVALLGEAFGIRLPRHVRGFVAELPGVNSALSAAFSATAIFFLIEALAQGAEKLSNFIANTFIYTQAAKDGTAAQIVLNQKFLETAQAIGKAKEALEDYGLSAVQKTRKAIEDHSQSLVDNTTKIETNKLKMAELAREQEASEAAASELGAAVGSMPFAFNTEQVQDNTQAIQALKDANALLTKGMEQLNAEMKVLNLQLRDEEDAARKSSLAKQAAYGQAQISGAKTVGTALLAVLKAQAEAAIVFDGSSAEKRLMIDQQFGEREYQLSLSTAQALMAITKQAENQNYQIERANLENRLSVQKSMGAAGVEAVKATQVQIEELAKSHGLKLATEEAKSNAEIEALQKNHVAKQITEASKLRVDFDVINAEIQRSALARGLFPNLPADTRDVLSMASAATKLGVTLSGDLKKSAADAAAALKVLDMEYKAGLITLRDYQQAQMKALQAQIAYDKEMGISPKLVRAEEVELAKLTKTFDTMYPEIKKTQTFWDAFTVDFKKKAKETSTVGEQMGQVMANTAKQMDQAFATAIVGAIASGNSIGQALAQATKAILTQLAEQALAKSLYYTAEGIAAATIGDPQAAGFFAAAGEFALVAGAAGAAGFAMGSPGGGHSTVNNVSSSSNPTGVSQSSSAGGSSNQTASVTRLASGGIVSRPTMFVAGDGLSSGAADEAIIPLSDPAALARISNALLSAPTLRAASAGMRSSAAFAAAAAPGQFDEARMAKFAERIQSQQSQRDTPESNGGDTHIHVSVKGSVDHGTIAGLVQKINRKVKNRQLTLKATDSQRVTRRSQ